MGGETLWSQEGTTQGDTLAMAMYAIATVPLIQKIQTIGNTQVWYADDASSGGKLGAIRQWWDNLVTYGPQFGYFPNGMKSWLLVKPEFLTEAEKLFKATDINITTVGRIHLGAAIKSENFCQTFQQNKVTEWKEQITKLAKIAQTQPHSAYSALVHGLKGRWTFATRTNEFHSDCLSPLESSIYVNN